MKNFETVKLIAYELLVFDKNTWNHIIMNKLLLLDKDTSKPYKWLYLIKILETISLIVCLVEFSGISTIIGYLMPNPVFTYISSIWFVNTFCRYPQLNDQTVLFLTIQFSISHLFAVCLNIKQFYLTYR